MDYGMAVPCSHRRRLRQRLCVRALQSTLCRDLDVRIARTMNQAGSACSGTGLWSTLAHRPQAQRQALGICIAAIPRMHERNAAP